MTTDIGHARNRMIADPVLLDRLVSEIGNVAAEIRRNHPAGPDAIDAELTRGLQAAGFLAGGEQLLAIEALRRRFRDLADETEKEAERKRAVHFREALVRDRVMRTGGVGQPHRDPELLAAVALVRQRLETLAATLSQGSEYDFGALLADMEASVKSFQSAMGLARRAARIRLAAIEADKAVAAARNKRAA